MDRQVRVVAEAIKEAWKTTHKDSFSCNTSHCTFDATILAKAAIASSDASLVPGLVKALRRIASGYHGKCGVCGQKCDGCITCDCERGYWVEEDSKEIAMQTLSSLPPEYRNATQEKGDE